MKKVIQSLGILLAVVCMPITVFAEEVCVSGDGAQAPLNEQETVGDWWNEKEDFGYVEFPTDVHSIHEGTDVNLLETGEELPVSYDGRENGAVSGVRNQNPWGTCWSFVTIGALESSLLSQNIYTGDIDLSEYHFLNYNYQSVTDPQQGTIKDSVKYNGTMAEFLGAGGNVTVGFQSLANWMGGVAENSAKYPKSNPQVLEHTVQAAYLQDIVHLQQMYQINKADTDAIKKEIMNYGAVTASFYYSESYFNARPAAYYTDSLTGSNHAVLIIGWDDNYSKDNFLVKPSENGAWLVKNSWGTWFGDDGYFWLSYEDTSLQDEMCVLVGESADNYDHNYQYDGSYMNTYCSAAGAANIFRVPEGETKEVLRAVSFQLGNTNTLYSIQIYKNLKNLSNPESGTPQLKQPQEGLAVYQGYHTIELEKTVELNPGDIFSVVITYESNETPKIVLEDSRNWNNTTYVAGAKENQSYIKNVYTVKQGGNIETYYDWCDTSSLNSNVRIKAFTDNTEMEKDKISLDGKTIELTIGEEKQLKVFFNGKEQSTAGNDDYFWEITGGDAADVDADGNLTGKKKGSCTISCVSEADPKLHAEATVLIKTGFEDIRSVGWEYPYVIKVYENGIMTGKTGTLFGTVDELTRAEFVTMLYAYAEKPECTYQGKFKDVAQDMWFAYPISWAYGNGIVSGYGDEFGIVDHITREQLVLMLYKYAQHLGLKTNVEANILKSYSDEANVSSYAYTAMEWAVTNGLLNGRNSKLAAQETTTRAECAVIMTKFMELKDETD